MALFEFGERTEPATPRQLAALDSATGNLFTTAFAPDGNSVYAAGSGRAVHRWNVDLGSVLATICQSTGAPMTSAEWARLVPDVEFVAPCTVDARAG
jgi:hypothetical protein